MADPKKPAANHEIAPHDAVKASSATFKKPDDKAAVLPNGRPAGTTDRDRVADAFKKTMAEGKDIIKGVFNSTRADRVRVADAFDKTITEEKDLIKGIVKSLRESARKDAASAPPPGITGKMMHAYDKFIDAGIEFVGQKVESLGSRKNGEDQHTHMPKRTEVNPSTATPAKTQSQAQGI